MVILEDYFHEYDLPHHRHSSSFFAIVMGRCSLLTLSISPKIILIINTILTNNIILIFNILLINDHNVQVLTLSMSPKILLNSSPS